MTEGPWTEADQAKLKHLVSKSLSAQQIADQIDRSRNAVIGRVKRSGLRLHGSPLLRSPKPKALPKPKFIRFAPEPRPQLSPR